MGRDDLGKIDASENGILNSPLKIIASTEEA